ncbi:MAG TPA: hypothetical protein VFA89_06345 [Terriglobales bacterium]|nr:hypothetical protein [Terriglobales bacterium]
MQCAEFEALLSDALDQVLSRAKLESFHAHARVCPVCGPLFSEAEAGQHWLKSLKEVEAPANLVNNILADTVGLQTGRLTAKDLGPSWMERVREVVGSWFEPVVGVVRQPRFAMSFGMAFFSISVAMSVAGVKASDLKHVDLRPSAVMRAYYLTSGRVVKYYENIRFVYEIESRMRELKKATTPAEPPPPKDSNHKNNTSGQPEQRQERNYSRDENQPVLAYAPEAPSVVMVTTNRRYV